MIYSANSISDVCEFDFGSDIQWFANAFEELN